jgi:hypothetical protein
MAATESDVVHPSATPWATDPVQHTLYAATLAAGAMPDTVPNRLPSTTTLRTRFPAAVDAVCDPWPSPSRGEK